MNEDSIGVNIEIKAKFEREYVLCIKEVLEAIKSDGETRIMDAGCGKRTVLRFYDGIENFLVIGCDVIPDVKLNSFSYDGLVLASIENLPFREDSFSMVIATFVIEHLADPNRALRELFYALKPGGYFVFVTPNLLNYTVQISNIAKNSLFIHKFLRYLAHGKSRYYENATTYYKCNLPWKLENTLTSLGFQKIILECMGNASFYFEHIPVLKSVSRIGDRITDRGFLRNLKAVLLGIFQKPVINETGRNNLYFA